MEQKDLNKSRQETIVPDIDLHRVCTDRGRAAKQRSCAGSMPLLLLLHFLLLLLLLILLLILRGVHATYTHARRLSKQTTTRISLSIGVQNQYRSVFNTPKHATDRQTTKQLSNNPRNAFNRETDRQTERETERETHTHKRIY